MKTCFKCNQEKPFSEFYKHPKMACGYLGKCKECNKQDSRDSYRRKAEDPAWMEKERKRTRTKERIKRNGSDRILDRVDTLTHRQANIIFGNAVRDGRIIRKPCQICGKENAQGHHEDYNKPLDVFWVCTRHHQDRHIHLRYCKLLKIAPTEINQFFKELSEKSV